MKFEFPDGPMILDIDVIDNPGAQSWADFFLPNITEAEAHVESPFVIWDYNTNALTQYLSTCKNLVAELSSLVDPYTGPMPETIDQITRDFTNSLHRYFTHTQRGVHDRFPLNANPDHDEVKLQKHITKLLVDLNDNIHCIERYMMPVVPSVELNEIYVSSEPAYDNPRWWKMDQAHRQYHTAEHADIILGSQILGKTILRSYCDGDNPNDWDTSGHYTNGGALQIQTGPRFRNEIYTSENFKNWLAQWGLTPETAWFDYPIGNIKNKHILPDLVDRIRQNKNKVHVTYGR